MSFPFRLTDGQMAHFQPFFPKSRGKPRIHNQRVSRGIIFIDRNGLRRSDATTAKAPIQTAQSDRDHVWQAQRLAARGNAIRQMPERIPLSSRARRARYLLAMSPELRAH